MGRARKADRLLVQAEREILATTPDGQARPRVDRNKTPLVGWHPPADDLAWLDAQCAARGGGRGVRSAMLTEALQMFRLHHEDTTRCPVVASRNEPSLADQLKASLESARDDLGPCPSHPGTIGDH